MGDAEPGGFPTNLLCAAQAEGRTDWLNGVPDIVASSTRRWSLTVGAPFQPGGQTAWVAPARDGRGRRLVLKIAWRHAEAEHEADGLAVWDGAGAVRLFAVEEYADTIAMLVECCEPGHPLSAEPEPTQDVVIAGLLRRLWRAPPSAHRFRSLAAMCATWADQFEVSLAAGRSGIDPGVARESIAVFRDLPTTATGWVLLCTDLHAGNVLAAEREPWLVIDPKPYVGDPHYDAVQHMLNCEERLLADPLGLVRRMAGLLDLDAARLQLWLFARCVQESSDWPRLGAVATSVAP
jgi:streptomycin 6-kinase